MSEYIVVKCVDGVFDSVIAGLGENEGTWDTTLDLDEATNQVKHLAGSAEDGVTYKIEDALFGEIE